MKSFYTSILILLVGISLSASFYAQHVLIQSSFILMTLVFSVGIAYLSETFADRLKAVALAISVTLWVSLFIKAFEMNLLTPLETQGVLIMSGFLCLLFITMVPLKILSYE